MQGERGYRRGEGFEIRGDKDEWVVDRARGQVRVTHKSWFRGPSERAFPLGNLVGVTLRVSQVPPATLAGAVNVLRTALDEARSGRANPERLASRMPKGLFVRLDESTDEGRPRETELSFSVDGFEGEPDLVVMAYQIADATGLGYHGVFVLPEVGVEVRLSRASGSRLKALGELGGEAERKRAAATALAVAGLPPFEPHRFQSPYKVDAWDPGRRVVFRRPFSKWAFAIFPFTLLLLVGPGIVVAELATGRELNAMRTLILSVVCAAFGIPCLALFLGMLPRSVLVDWSTRTLSIRRWPRQQTIPLESILGLEAHARFYEASSGDGGGSSATYACELQARVRSSSHGEARKVDLLETDHLLEPDRPRRETFPLVAELAKALGVPHRTKDYSFRNGTR
jgi:hypothetical protein